MSTALVAGAGGFIGGHLVRSLLSQGHAVRAVDIKPPHAWWQRHADAENWFDYDLRLRENCEHACQGNVSHVYNLAADMGGIGFISTRKADCMLSVLINTHLLQSANDWGISRYFYSSSACVYHADLQNSPTVTPLKESDAYHNNGAMPEDGYGWEKLFSERMCRHFHEDYGLETRVARFHNIYGPYGTWRGPRTKAPAALCAKVAKAKHYEYREVPVWGDGTQTRSFCWIDDCIHGIHLLMESDCHEPLNIGSSELVSINTLLCLISTIACHPITPIHEHDKPQGVAGRNSDNTRILQLFDWEPNTSLSAGLVPTYEWISTQIQYTLQPWSPL